MSSKVGELHAGATVQANGTTISAFGCTVAYVSAGVYDVTYARQIDFACLIPSFCSLQGGRCAPALTNITDTGFRVTWNDVNGLPGDTAFGFTMHRSRVGNPTAFSTLGTSASAYGGDRKDSVRLATVGALPAYTRTGNVIVGNAPGALNDGTGADTIDSVTVVTGNDISLENGAAGADNGIWHVDDAGGATAFQLTRRSDANTDAKVTSGMYFPVTEGGTLGGSFRRLTTVDPIVLNTTALVFGGLDAVYPTLIRLAAQTAPPGASLIGVRDPNLLFGGTNALDTALENIAYIANQGRLRARGVETTNVANLAAFPVAGTDGVAGGYQTGERVLLAGQTAPAENGLYVVGVIAGPNAPLTRAPELAANIVAPSGIVCEVSEGTLNGPSEWKITTAGDIQMGVTAHNWYPKSITREVVLVAGTATVSNVPVLSATKSNVLLSRKVANTSNLTVGGYHPTTGGANGITAGTVGAAAVIIEACVAAGTINNADISTLLCTIQNW